MKRLILKGVSLSSLILVLFNPSQFNIKVEKLRDRFSDTNVNINYLFYKDNLNVLVRVKNRYILKYKL